MIFPECKLFTNFFLKRCARFYNLTDDVSATGVLCLLDPLSSLSLIFGERAHDLTLACLELRHHVLFNAFERLLDILLYFKDEEGEELRTKFTLFHVNLLFLLVFWNGVEVCVDLISLLETMYFQLLCELDHFFQRLFEKLPCPLLHVGDTRAQACLEVLERDIECVRKLGLNVEQARLEDLNLFEKEVFLFLVVYLHMFGSQLLNFTVLVLLNLLVCINLDDGVTFSLELGGAHLARAVSDKLLLFLGVALHGCLVSIELLVDDLV